MKNHAHLILASCATLLLAACDLDVESTPPDTGNSQSSVPARFNIDSYNAVANGSDTLEGLWALVPEDTTISMSFPMRIDPGTDPGNPDTFIDTELLQTFSGPQRVLCFISSADDPATTDTIEYLSTCGLGDDVLIHNPESHSLVSADASVALTESSMHSASGTMTDSSGPEPLSANLSMKRIGELTTNIGQFTLTVDGSSDTETPLVSFAEALMTVGVSIPGINRSYSMDHQAFNAFTDTGLSVGTGPSFALTPDDSNLDGAYDVVHVGLAHSLTAISTNLSATDSTVHINKEMISDGDGDALPADDHSLTSNISAATVNQFTADFSGVDENSGLSFSGDIQVNF